MTLVILIAQTLFLSVKLTYRVRYFTNAAPNINIPMTASFFLSGNCTPKTIGIGNIKITTSAITSVYSRDRNIGTVSTHLFP
jgi:hypothetical protein